MEGHDETRRERTRPAGPQQPDTGFEEGLAERSESAAEEPEPSFARGLEDDGEDQKPRFSRGLEQAPGSAQNRTERRFSEGLEREPGSD